MAKKRSSDDLKPLFVRIDRRLYEALKSLVMKRFGSNYWGGMRIIVEEALRKYIEAHNIDINVPNNVKINRQNPPPRVHSVYLQVRSYLNEKYGEHMDTTYQHLAEAISYVRGSDPRTIKKWISLFLKYGCIKHIGGVVYELL